MNISDRKGVIGFDEFSEIKKPANNDSFVSYQTNLDSKASLEQEPPLLEELGIDPAKIRDKLMQSILVKRPDRKFIQEPDLTGPLLLSTLLGTLLLLVRL